ncbi:type II toxin-antitoxin system VapC family toxin [Haloechinothrix sp. LS1_15]|uniref:type II toxin-antitoxin system VapC family toxin n=1 Tax=Haloechinothrix sp. LS1_15 TaxID=2652248 RepID=UPI00294698A0|nr:type II toxin-antitoxin system VapC family toxin [Haloechinothrix sp. LS1_15]MDV6011889.1 type II toxin-antitoxin system VapC family toxin [Haloechinothrix sp. LS1_15]
MIVVDSSAIVHALIDHPVNPDLLVTLGEHELCAPHLLDFEVASAIRGHVRGQKLRSDRGRQALDDYVNLKILRYEGAGLLPEIWHLENFTCYDAAYIALAIALRVPLVTSDDKHAEASRLGIDVRVFPAGS